MTEDVFPIEHSDFPASHSLVFRGVYIYIYILSILQFYRVSTSGFWDKKSPQKVAIW